MYKIILLLLLLSINPTSSLGRDKKINSGIWRTELKIGNNKIIPFTFNYHKEENKIVIINATEMIELKYISINKDKITVGFPIFNSEFIGKIKSKKRIEGFWHNYSKGHKYKIPFTSTFGRTNRFNKVQSNSKMFNGKWEVTFDYNDSKEKAIGLFEQKEGRIDGTFLTETGDYRFLEGTSSADSLWLSCFDGSHAFLFDATLKKDTLWGNFYSGNHYHTTWYAVKNESFELTDPEKLTYIINDSLINFTLKDLENKDYTYPNDSVKGKVVLIQIFGSWCPNCFDETNYLTHLYDTHSDQLEIISLGFETGKTTEDKIKQLKKYKSYMKVNYKLLIGGDACKSCANDIFPMLNKIISFPTLIIIDKKGEIKKIHTGFSGPSTGHYYKEFVKNTTQFIEDLINS